VFLGALDQCEQTAEEDAGTDDEHTEENVRDCCYPEGVPVQRRVTVRRVFRVICELVQRRIDPHVTWTQRVTRLTASMLAKHQGRSDGGYIGTIYTPKISPSKRFMG